MLLISCKNQEEIKKYNVPSSCVSISRSDGDYLIVNEVNTLYISVNGIPLSDLEVELTIGEVLSFEYGVCKVKVTQGKKTKLTVKAKTVDYSLVEKEFSIIEKL